jgi:hypothetical protein
LQAGKKTGMETRQEKTIVLSPHWDKEENRNIRIVNKAI